MLIVLCGCSSGFFNRKSGNDGPNKDWLLSVSDSIVDFVPSIQQSSDGATYEVIATHPRADLALNLPALKKLDSMLITMLDVFCKIDFWYVDRGIVLAEGDSC
ncbi:putative PRONE domain, Rop guanine nucleotide exchange factor [Helianthus anomalus]